MSDIKAKHSQKNKEIGCVIPFSRCEDIMINNIINKEYYEKEYEIVKKYDVLPGHIEAAKIKKELDDYKTQNKIDKPDAALLDEKIINLIKLDKKSPEGQLIKEEKKKISDLRTRVSNDAAIVGSVIVQEIIEECFVIALTNCIPVTASPLISVNDLFTGFKNIEEMLCYPLFRDGKNYLKIYGKYVFDEDTHRQKEIVKNYEVLMSMKTNDSKIINYNTVATKLGLPIGAEITESSTDSPTEKEPIDSPKRFFYSYVHTICKSILDKTNASFRIQSDLCELLSCIAYDTLTSIGNGIVAYYSYEKTKTIRADDIEQIIKIILYCSDRANHNGAILLFEKIKKVRADNIHLIDEKNKEREDKRPEDEKQKIKEKKERKEQLAEEMKLLNEKIKEEKKKEAELIKQKYEIVAEPIKPNDDLSVTNVQPITNGQPVTNIQPQSNSIPPQVTLATLISNSQS